MWPRVDGRVGHEVMVASTDCRVSSCGLLLSSAARGRCGLFILLKWSFYVPGGRAVVQLDVELVLLRR